jgi:homoserine O-acetyltransferase/O-succinyltransferase
MSAQFPSNQESCFMKVFGLLSLAASLLTAVVPIVMPMSEVKAADYPAPKVSVWIAPNFVFASGETLPELKLHYTTIGEPTGEPVVVLHGTAGSGASLLTPEFAGELFGPGQPLDATKYFIILPDAIGTGKSAKPSDGLRGKFPKYTYDDMVAAQYRLVTEGLKIPHVRMVLGYSMGGMHTWIWGEKYPLFMDALVPLACQPSEMSSRNWVMRRLVIDSIRNDPEWLGGDYKAPLKAFQTALVYYGVATNGGTQAWQRLAPTRAAADKMLTDRLAAASPIDANDLLYQYDASRDYNPSPKLDEIRAQVLAINAADDERNPPELGIMERELARIKSVKFYLIPASDQTRGHGTYMIAKLWTKQLSEFLVTVPNRLRFGDTRF